jgi:manganese/iron transport system permease protein
LHPALSVYQGIAAMNMLLEPFGYSYMVTAMVLAGLVGALCGFLSAFLVLRGWSLIGDGLAHAIVPGVAAAWMLGLPFSFGAFLAGGLAAGAMLFVNSRSVLKPDAAIGVVFTGFFALGLFLISLNPVSVNLQSVTMGNILAVSPSDVVQLALIGASGLTLLAVKWRDLGAVFFDEDHARSIGLKPQVLKAMFFVVLAATAVAAMQAVGAFLVVALIIIPGATAHLLTDRFGRMIWIAVGVGTISGPLGTYASYFLDGATGGLIVCVQALAFALAFVLAPKHGLLGRRRTARKALAAKPAVAR